VNIQVTVELALQNRLRMVRHQGFRISWSGRLIGTAVLAVGLFDRTLGFLLVPLGVLLILGPELLTVIAYLGGRKFGTTYTYTLTDSGLDVATQASSTHVEWAMFGSVDQSADYWRLQLTGSNVVTLPKSAFTPEQTAEWQAFLTTSGLVRA